MEFLAEEISPLRGIFLCPPWTLLSLVLSISEENLKRAFLNVKTLNLSQCSFHLSVCSSPWGSTEGKALICLQTGCSHWEPRTCKNATTYCLCYVVELSLSFCIFFFFQVTCSSHLVSCWNLLLSIFQNCMHTFEFTMCYKT